MLNVCLDPILSGQITRSEYITWICIDIPIHLGGTENVHDSRECLSTFHGNRVHLLIHSTERGGMKVINIFFHNVSDSRSFNAADHQRYENYSRAMCEWGRCMYSMALHLKTGPFPKYAGEYWIVCATFCRFYAAIVFDVIYPFCLYVMESSDCIEFSILRITHCSTLLWRNAFKAT